VSHASAAERAARVLSIEAESILALRDRLGDSFGKAVDLLLAAPGKVVVTGMGKSGIVGRKIASTLASTGTPAFFLHPAEGIHGDIGMVHEGDVVVALSNSGETAEVTALLPAFKRLGLPLIALTGVPASTLGRYADAVLDVAVKEEACSLGLAPTSSTTATMALGDALAVALLDLRGFTAEDFALFHPGGSLGRRLTLTVEDAMHSGDSVPRVGAETLLREALFEITGKKLGMTTVLDGEGRLAGIITDGDLRRLMEKVGDPLGKKAGEVMTKNPLTIARDEMATVALRMMEERSITSLVVVDAGNRVEGVLHLHDLLKAGI